MPSDRRRAATFLVIAAVALTGCGVLSPGSAVSGKGTGVGSPDTLTTRPSATPDTSSLPSRPRDIDLQGVDPCTLLTGQQLADLALDPEPVGGGSSTRATGDLACSFLASADQPPRVGFQIALETGRDAGALLVPDSNGVTTAVAEVAGFPAVREAGPERSSRPCLFAVSTSQGTFLEVRLDYDSGLTGGVLPLEQACERTLQAATFAMQTLQAQR